MATAPRKVVFPAAGFGTRLLPATTAFPKELLPLVDRPIIQYGVEEAVRADMRQVILVTNPGNTMTAAHFEPHPELEALLGERGKTELLAAVRALSAMATITTVHQPKPRGLGHAVLLAKESVGDEAFAVVLADDVIDADPPTLSRMCELYAEFEGPVLLVERVSHEAVGRYGVIDAEPIRDGVYRVRDLVEKPSPDHAPSDLAIVGRYVLTPDLFPALDQTDKDAGGEIQLTGGLRRLLQERPIYAYELRGIRYDVGNRFGLIQATLHFALKRSDLGPQLREYLKTLK